MPGVIEQPEQHKGIEASTPGGRPSLAPVQATQADRELTESVMCRDLRDGAGFHVSKRVVRSWAQAIASHVTAHTSALTAERDALSQQLERVSAERDGLRDAIEALHLMDEDRMVAAQGKDMILRVPFSAAIEAVRLTVELSPKIALAQTPPKI